MRLPRMRHSGQLIPIHRDNLHTADWVILLEVGTIVDKSDKRLRVARVTRARKIVRRYWLLKPKTFIAIEDFDPRLHMIFLCPQLYRYDKRDRLIPLGPNEIGQFVAKSLDSKAIKRRPWYKPSEAIPAEPIIRDSLLSEFDSLLVEQPMLPSPATAPHEIGFAGKYLESGERREDLPH